MWHVFNLLPSLAGNGLSEVVSTHDVITVTFYSLWRYYLLAASWSVVRWALLQRPQFSKLADRAAASGLAVLVRPLPGFVLRSTLR